MDTTTLLQKASKICLIVDDCEDNPDYLTDVKTHLDHILENKAYIRDPYIVLDTGYVEIFYFRGNKEEVITLLKQHHYIADDDKGELT